MYGFKRERAEKCPGSRQGETERKKNIQRDSKCISFCLVIRYPCNVSEMATVKVHATLGKQSGLHWNLIEVNCVWNIWCRNKTPYVLWERGAAYLALVLLSEHVCALYQFEIIQVWLVPSRSSQPEWREPCRSPRTHTLPLEPQINMSEN